MVEVTWARGDIKTCSYKCMFMVYSVNPEVWFQHKGAKISADL